MRIASRQPSNHSALENGSIQPRGEDLAALGGVVAAVEQDVADRVANLARRPQRAGVVAVREQAAAAVEQRVDAAREPHAEALHAAREGGLASGLDDQVEMIAQDVEVDDAEVTAMTAGRDRGPHHAHDALAAQRRQAADDPQGDVDRRARREAWV